MGIDQPGRQDCVRKLLEFRAVLPGRHPSFVTGGENADDASIGNKHTAPLNPAPGSAEDEGGGEYLDAHGARSTY